MFSVKLLYTCTWDQHFDLRFAIVVLFVVPCGRLVPILFGLTCWFTFFPKCLHCFGSIPTTINQPIRECCAVVFGVCVCVCVRACARACVVSLCCTVVPLEHIARHLSTATIVLPSFLLNSNQSPPSPPLSLTCQF